MWSIYLQLLAFFALGIYLGDRVSAGDACIFIAAVVLTSLLRKLALKKFFSFKAFVILVSAFGILLYHHAISDSIRPAYRFSEKYVTVIGKITDLPKKESDHNIYFADVRMISYLGEDLEVRERIRITSDEEYKFGDSIVAKGFLKTFPQKLNRGDFDSGRSSKAKGVYFKMHANEIEPCKTRLKNYSPAYFAAAIKNRISNEIYKNYSGDDAAVLKAVLTGYRDGFSDELEETLYDSNMMRMFYPSYMHIYFIVSLAGALSIYVGKKKRNYLLMAMLVLYAFFNLNTHYVMKSALLAAAVVYSKNKTGFSNYIDTLAIIVLVMLVINPLMGYEAGFILSVMSNILLFYFVPPVMQWLGLKKKQRFIAVWLVLSIGMLPLQAYFFYNTTPYAFLLNVLYAPLLSALWACGAAKLVFLPAGKFNPASPTVTGLLYFMRKIPEVVSRLPGYSIPLPRPGVLMIAAFYVVLYYLRGRYYKKRKNDMTGQAAIAIVIGFAISGSVGFLSTINDLEINFVNVGQGDGAVLSIPFRETIIIDGGGSSEFSDYDYGKQVFVPYLKREGHNKIDLAVVSHYHSDHCKGVIDAMKKLTVKEVLMPDCMEDNEYRRKIEELAEEKHIKLSYMKSGAKLTFKSGVTLHVISPDDTDLTVGDENDTSFGIKVDYGKFSALFTGDATAEVEKNHSGEWGRCTIVKVPHHGSVSSSSEEFVEETSPNAAIISVGAGNSYGHPREEVVTRYINSGASVYRTDIYGDITVDAKKNGGYKISAFVADPEDF